MKRLAAKRNILEGAFPAGLLAVVGFCLVEPARARSPLLQTTSWPQRHEGMIEADVTIQRSVGGAGETLVREVMKPPLGRLGRALLAFIGKFPAEEVTANLHRLKQIMETGKVTDTSYFVKSKSFEH
jgi:hypothetical protein